MVNLNRKSRIGNRQSMRQSPIANVAMYGAAFVVLAAPLSAQQPTFRTGTTLIEFTLVALDSDGKPVTDLTKEDVVLTEGGEPREIAFFRFDGDAPAVSDSPRPALPPGFVTNRHVPERNVTAIVLDMVNVGATDAFGQTAVRGLLLKYLNALPPNTQVGIFRFAETQPMATLQTFTDRLDLLRPKIRSLNLALRLEIQSSRGGGGRAGAAGDRSAFAEAERRANAGEGLVIHQIRLSRTLAGLDALGTHLAGIPGRKSLIWITNAPPIRFNDEGGSEVSYQAQRLREAAQHLANQGIAVYPVSTGLRASRSDDETDRGTFGVFANTTGGRAVVNTNDLADGVSIAARDQRGTYTVGFYAADEADDRWRPLKVELKRRSVTVRHRQGYLAVRRAQPQNWPAKAWNDLAYQPLESTGIHLNGRTSVAGSEATVSLQIATRDLYFHTKDGQLIADLEIGLVEQAPKRKTTEPTNVRVQPMEITLKDPATAPSEVVPVETTWSLNPGTTAVRAIVRDRFTGKYGTLELPVNR
jgi:VWFA-related protein